MSKMLTPSVAQRRGVDSHALSFQYKGKRRCRLHGGLSTGPKTAEGRARIAAASTRHGKFVGWRAHREKEKYYFGEIKRIMKEAKEAGMLEGK